MSDRALRGSRLGTQSFEDERGVEMAPRQQVAYVTESGHEFRLTLSAEAEVPFEWESPQTGEVVQGPPCYQRREGQGNRDSAARTPSAAEVDGPLPR